MGLIADLKAAKEAEKSDADLATARYLQRRAQFYLDFVEAENSTGFHAPQEAARILAESLNYARQGQLAVARSELQADGSRRPDPAASGSAHGGAGRQAVTDGESCPLGGRAGIPEREAERWGACAPGPPATARRSTGSYRLGGNSVAETVVASMIVAEFIADDPPEEPPAPDPDRVHPP